MAVLSVPQNEWGIKPILFSIGKFPIEAYPFFLTLAVIVALGIYYFENKKNNNLNDNTFFIAVGALFGGVLGAKLPIWVYYYKEIIQALPNISFFLSGRTIVGGMVGGAIGVNFTRWLLGIKERRGNIFVIPACVGIAIGRLGCFFRGCCFGKPTNSSFGVDFGDHILRHPTQLYEIVFALIFLVYALRKKEKAKPGELFQNFMITYFIFRFFVEFFRESPVIAFHLTPFQIASLLIVLYYIIVFKLIPIIKKNGQ